MKVAIVTVPLIEKLGYGDFLHRGFSQHCEAVKMKPGEEVEGFDHYYYIDEYPYYFPEPKFHPGTLFAIDFVVPHVWFVPTPDSYVERFKNWEHAYVFTKPSLEYCNEKGLTNVKLTGFAADPQYHASYDIDKEYDWIAIWHNCEDRPQVCDAAMAKFPNGRVMWAGNGPDWKSDKDYCYWMNKGKCALNHPRAKIVNMRVFEVMAMGIPLVTQRVADMPDYGFVENEHYLGYDTIEEMLDKIQWVKDCPQDAAIIAHRAREFVLRNHTYSLRAGEILADTLV